MNNTKDPNLGGKVRMKESQSGSEEGQSRKKLLNELADFSG